MNRLLPLALVCLSLLAICACRPEGEPQRPGQFGGPVKPLARPTPPQPTVLPPDNGPAMSTPTPAVASTPPPAPSPKVQEYPYGIPVQGKPGFVTSPHAPDSGYVDVRGFAPGQEVRDPYTNKIFLVP